MTESQKRIERDNDRRILRAVKSLPWGEDKDINGGDLVDLLSVLVLHPERAVVSPLLDYVVQPTVQDNTKDVSHA